ncbi:metallophosphoesterase [Nakamurella sp.]|uniref:metallophosphoesterase n=1 Tax=Nakamurella sp. TaxID=1869182 RepID=UPI0037852E05
MSEPGPATRRRLPGPFALVIGLVLVLLHGLPWWVLVLAPRWPVGLFWTGTVTILIAVATFPVAMIRGHGRRHDDRWAIAGDSWLGVIWLLFSWSVIGGVVDVGLLLGGVPSPTAQRWTAGTVLVVVLILAAWGMRQALRLPRVRRTQITLDRLDPAFDGTRIVLLADTHYGPIDRARWSARLVDAVNRLDPDVVAHAGDLADGSVDQRRAQVAPLASVRAGLARAYITGNHEYFSGAEPWVRHMADLGWSVLHNRHLILRRGTAHLALAGIDDLTAAGSGLPGHHADLPAALAGIPSDVPVVLLAHQPKQVRAAVAAGVDLQLSGHTHGGQIWPFHLLVRVEQGALQGLSRPGGRTQLYTTRGAGFWGPPLRVFAPSEISLLILRSGSPQPRT